MNTQQRVMEAQRVLELALKEYLKTASKKERLLAGIALNFDAELADTLGKKGVLFVAGGIAKAIIDTENGESVGKQLEGILGDLATMGITSAGYFVKRTPLGFAVSTAMDLAGIDLSSFLKHYYDVITGDKDALLLDEIEIKVYGGVLKVTMKDGTVYARPIDPNGTYDRSIYGKSGDDVLFGGTGNDHLNGLGGNNILIGGKGADHYKAYDGDTIIDSDGVGYVELGIDRLNGGKWDKDKNAYVGGILENIYYTLDKDNGTLTVKSDAGTITIENYNKDKKSLGIVLQDSDKILEKTELSDKISPNSQQTPQTSLSQQTPQTSPQLQTKQNLQTNNAANPQNACHSELSKESEESQKISQNIDISQMPKRAFVISAEIFLTPSEEADIAEFAKKTAYAMSGSCLVRENPLKSYESKLFAFANVAKMDFLKNKNEQNWKIAFKNALNSYDPKSFKNALNPQLSQQNANLQNSKNNASNLQISAGNTENLQIPNLQNFSNDNKM